MTNDTRPQPGDTVYRSFRNDRVDSRGVYVGTYYGTVSPCGEWVDVGDRRHRLTREWHLRMVDAEATEADQLERFAAVLIEQAQRLRDAAKQEVPA